MPDHQPHAAPGLHAVTARAGVNVALVKYWGKRPDAHAGALNLPATGSLSLTLDATRLGTETRVQFIPGLAPQDGVRDHVLWKDGGAPDAATAARVSRFLDRVRALADLDLPAEIITHNTVPTASGLASSASAFAALALAATRAAGLSLSPTELSALARCGSGSAARSMFGGFAEMRAGRAADGGDAHAIALHGPEHWEVSLVVAINSERAKPLGSTAAMNHTSRTSPYQDAWIASVPADLDEARAAIAARDLVRLGPVIERSCLRMHAAALAADPGVIYWNSATMNAIHAVMDLRAASVAAYFTIDAGPHVKVLCAAGDADRVARALSACPGVLRTLIAQPGADAAVIPQGAM